MTSSGLRVLVLQSDPAGLGPAVDQALKELQARYEAVLTFASSLADAERAAGVFDVILLDLLLPNGLGAEVSTRVSARYPDTPIVILTRLTDPEAVKAAMALPTVWDYQPTDSVDCEQLLRSIAHALDFYRVELMFETCAATGKAATRLGALAALTENESTASSRCGWRQ